MIWFYNPDGICKDCGETDTSFFGGFKNKKFFLHNVCFLCKREKLRATYKRNYKKNKNKILKKNKDWRVNNYDRYISNRRKYEIKKIMENMYMTERV